MKNIRIILQIFLISFSLIGCSYIELTDLPSSDNEAKRILSFGLTHSENLSEANNLKDQELVIAVVEKLERAEDQKNKILLDEQNVIKYAEMVKVFEDSTANSITFLGPEVFKKEKSGFFSNGFDNQDYFLKSLKSNNGIIKHQLHLSIKYTASNWRNYSSANFCDKWRCDEVEQIEMNLISSEANSCDASSCNYMEIMELSLSDDFLRRSMETGFTISVNSKKVSSKINVTSSYTRGYLVVAN